jgi:hypothetical protein
VDLSGGPNSARQEKPAEQQAVPGRHPGLGQRTSTLDQAEGGRCDRITDPTAERTEDVLRLRALGDPVGPEPEEVERRSDRLRQLTNTLSDALKK